jgi:hypothetical protein
MRIFHSWGLRGGIDCSPDHKRVHDDIGGWCDHDSHGIVVPVSEGDDGLYEYESMMISLPPVR